MKNKIFHLISNTHWDREWRFPFQRNRQMLVDMMDRLLEILIEAPEYKAFHLDSQSIVVKDYLEIRPHKKEIISRLVKEKRLFIGPWYILPDEFQVGGENLIRNLLLGHRYSREIGRVSKIGYSPFSWGQISQLPQIYHNFEIELIMFYRGINSLDSKKAEFIWEGADGTRMISSRFSTLPRYNFYFYIYRPAVHNEFITDVEYDWSSRVQKFHFADKHQCNEDYYIISESEDFYPGNIKPQVLKIIKDQANDFTTPHVIWMEGHDSSGPNRKTLNILNEIKKQMPELNVLHGTLEEYAAEVKNSLANKRLRTVKGERRSAQYDARSGNLYGYTTSARMYLKIENFNSERMLQYYAEPFNSFAGMLGKDIRDKYLETAWELLIQNSAHDSIGGCSLDEIHEDMLWRYRQVNEISKGVFERALKYIVSNIDTMPLCRNMEHPESEIYLVAFNPNNYTREEIIETFVDIPESLDRSKLEIQNIEGDRLEFQLKERKKIQPVLEQMTDRPMYLNMIRYHGYLRLKNIPPFGYKTIRVIPAENTNRHESPIARYTGGGFILENDKIKCSINKNGTFDLELKRAGIIFRRLGYLIDEGEGGTAWVNKKEKPFVTSLKSSPVIRLIENGHLKGVISIEHKLEIYPNLVERRKKSKRRKILPVTLNLTLTKISGCIETDITTRNNAESHRLRMIFPTGLNLIHSNAEGQFDVVARSTARPDTSDWIEQPMYDYPLHQFVDASDNKYGLAILSDGLKEYEILNDKNNSIAVTLFRAFEYIIEPSSRQDYTHKKGSQCLGESTYRLGIYPHESSWEKGHVYREALNFNNSVRLVQTSSSNGPLSPISSFMKIEPGELIFSALKKPEDGSEEVYVLRIFNPTNKKIKGSVRVQFGIEWAEQITLEEESVAKLPLADTCSFKVELKAKKILTVKLKIKL